MEIRIDGPMLVLRGDLDVRSTHEVRNAIYGLIARHEVVVIDCTEVTSIDMTAVKLLVVATRRAGLRGGQVVLRGCGPTVRRFLYLSHFRRALELEPVPA
ncbi:MAG: STAS domain-containing protein [Austwickia sp.]|nr:STAS domain-containing protein [Austwickia sp.]